MKADRVEHVFKPYYDKNSRVFILGTMPSPKSRELGFYYGHPQNRFWMVMAELLHEPFPETVEMKKALLRENKIALWDVLASCEIKGADDSSIKNPVANDMNLLLKETNIKAIFTTGAKATALYKRFCLPKCGIPSIGLPSTSPANCACSYDRLLEAYGQILKYI